MATTSRFSRSAAAGICCVAAAVTLSVFGPVAAASGAQAPFAARQFTAPQIEGGDTAVLGRDVQSLDGLLVEPSEPEAWTPSFTASGSDQFNYLVTVRFTNQGDESADLSDVMTEVSTDGGATRKIYDSANGVGSSLDAGRLAPGQSTTMKFGFSSETRPSYVNFDFKMFLGDDTAEFTYEW